MPYCPHCGNETEQLIPVASPVTDAVDREVEIARINAERDIEVAKIAARQDRDWNETRVEVAEVEAEAEVAAAVAEAEIIGDAIEASGADTDMAEPIVIDAPEAIAEDAPDDAPPEVQGSEPPAPSRKSAGIGFW